MRALEKEQEINIYESVSHKIERSQSSSGSSVCVRVNMSASANDPARQHLNVWAVFSTNLIKRSVDVDIRNLRTK